MTRNGFTLLELLLSIVILAVITAMVYGAFAGTVGSAGRSRLAVEEMRLRQFLGRSLDTNFTTIYTDPEYAQEIFRFVGINDESREGPKDSVRFCSTAPLIGGVALPGDLKEVRYEVLDSEVSQMELRWDDADTSDAYPAQLQVTETPLLAGNVQSVDPATSLFVSDPAYESPSWRVPVRTVNFQYFDGAQWVDEWDSQQAGRMPWAVSVKINFAKTEEQLEYEREKGFSVVDDPDFERVVPIRAGLGGRGDARMGSVLVDGSQAASQGGTSSTQNQGRYIPPSD